MEACPKTVVSEYPEHVIENGGERLLKVTSIYGPNGGGKSNLLKALSIFAAAVCGNYILNDSIQNENYYPNVSLNGEDTVFTIYVIRGGYEIGYSLTLDLNKMQQLFPNQGFMVQMTWAIDLTIKEEEMTYRKLSDKESKELFKRDEKGIVTCELLKNIDLVKNKRSLAKNYAFVKYFNDTFVQDKTNQNVLPLFEFYKEITSYIWPRKETQAFNYSQNEIEILTPCLGKAKELLNALDMKIANLEFRQKNPGNFYLYVERKGKDGKTFSIPVGNESKGTIKAINMVFDILTSQRESVCVIDDFDAHLHPKLIKAIVEMFVSKENDSRQLVFNSHDITNMSNKLFRRDEIWFAYRDEDYSTKYLPLSNIVNYKGEMVRKDAVYSKQYLEGRFGADPFIKKGLSWCDD